MADNKTFIRLNGFDVKDQKARDYIDSFKSLLGYEGDPNNGEKLTRIDNLDYYVNDLKELLGYVDANPGPDGVLGTEDDEPSKIGRLDEVQQKVDNIAEELGYKTEGDKIILDRLTNLENKVEENSGSTDSKFDNVQDQFEGVQNQFEEVQEQINAIHKHDNLDILNNISQDDIDNWNDKSFDDLEGTEDIAFIKDIPTLVSQLENDVPYFFEDDIIEQEIIDALITTFDSEPEDTPGEGEEPSDEPAVPEDPEKPLEPDYPYNPGEDLPEEYGPNLIKNGRFKEATTSSVPHWTLEGNIQIDDPIYQEVSEYFTVLILDEQQSHIKQVISEMQKNTVYTLSYDITWETAVSNYSILLEYYSANGKLVYTDKFHEVSMGHKNHFITSADMEFDYAILNITIHGLAQYSFDEANIFLNNFKLEEGFDETKWTEHPDLV